jgi:glycosyltransferase involved in cell wall biosynthesis
MADATERISCVVHTRNSAATLATALGSVAWADEIVVVDMASTDETAEIARAHGATLIGIPPTERVDGVRNQALEHAAGEWILVLDSDEHLAADAGPALRALIAASGREYDAFALPRFNLIAGQVMRGGMWYPDHQVRLFRRGTVRWTDSHHRHPEVVTGPHRVLELTGPGSVHLHHRNYESLSHFLRKQLDYALTDRYDPDPTRFSFAAYLARAHEQLALRLDREQDGDLSHALALALAWDAVIRGLVHWERLDPRPPLPALTALPELAPATMPAWQIRLRRWLWRRHPLRFLLHRMRARARALLPRRSADR